MIEINALQPLGLLVITAPRFGDVRGYFAETFRSDWLGETGFSGQFIQDNQASTAAAFTMRGLHFQSDPWAQDKLVRVVAGAILDIAVDIRVSSPTYGTAAAVELTAENGRQLLVPRGFAHGYLTLSEHTVVAYKVTNYYSAGHEGGLNWRDPTLRVPWPVPLERMISNARDANWPDLADLASPFA